MVSSEVVLALRGSSVAWRAVEDCANLGADHGCETGTQNETCPQLRDYGPHRLGWFTSEKTNTHLSWPSKHWCTSQLWFDATTTANSLCGCYPSTVCWIPSVVNLSSTRFILVLELNAKSQLSPNKPLSHRWPCAVAACSAHAGVKNSCISLRLCPNHELLAWFDLHWLITARQIALQL